MGFVDQRRCERSHVWLAIRMSTPHGDAFAVTYDVSEGGVLLLTSRPIDLGTRVTLTLDVPGSSPPRVLTACGRVVHEEVNLADPDGLWPRRVGVALEEAMEEFHATITGLVRNSPFAPQR